MFHFVLGYQCLLLGPGIGKKPLILVAVGMEGPMAESSLDRAPLAKKEVGPLAEEGVGKPLEDILHGLTAGMEHVLGVEAVVAQFVHHELVGRKVGRPQLAAQPVGSEQERRLGQLALVVAILAVADGTDGDDDLHVGAAATQRVDSLGKIVDALVYGQYFFLKQVGGPLLAVVNNYACFA